MQSEPGSGFPKAQGIRLHHREWDEAAAPDPGDGAVGVRRPLHDARLIQWLAGS